MATRNAHEAKLQGEELQITRSDVTVDESARRSKRPFPLGAARRDPQLNRAALKDDAWWQPMSDKEAEISSKGATECEDALASFVS